MNYCKFEMKCYRTVLYCTIVDCAFRFRFGLHNTVRVCQLLVCSYRFHQHSHSYSSFVPCLSFAHSFKVGRLKAEG